MGFDLEQRASTYDWDLDLFTRLGLKPFRIKLHTTTFVGAVVSKKGTVNISVYAAPAQFWTFKIVRTSDGKRFTLQTGSGGLGDYWPWVYKVLNGVDLTTNPKALKLVNDNMLVLTEGI